MKAEFCIYLFSSAVCLLVLYGFYRLFLHQETFFGFNRLFILFSVVFSCILPFIDIPIYNAGLLSLPIVQLPEVVLNPNASNASIANGTIFTWLWYGYVMVSIALLLRLFIQIGKVVSYAKTLSGKWHDQQYVICTEGKLPTFSFFHWLFWDNTATLSAESEAQVLQHEQAHIRQLHSLDIILLELAKIVCWFNPAIYLFKKDLQEVHEFLADRAVTRHYSPESYAQLMVQQLFSKLNLSLTQPFNQSKTQKRIYMLKASQTPMPALWKTGLATLLITLLFIVYACQPEASTPISPQQVAPDAKGAEQMPMLTLDQSPTLHNNQVFVVVEQMPEFPGGMDGMMQYLGRNISYPAEARQHDIQGTVFAQFVVQADGAVTDVKVTKGISGGCNAEAVRVIQAMPPWKPGKQNGKPVAVQYSLPIRFTL
jgi:TonB family protein